MQVIKLNATENDLIGRIRQNKTVIVLVDATLSPVTVRLPFDTGNIEPLTFVKTDATTNTVTVVEFDGTDSWVLTVHDETLTLHNDTDGNWYYKQSPLSIESIDYSQVNGLTPNLITFGGADGTLSQDAGFGLYTTGGGNCENQRNLTFNDIDGWLIGGSNSNGGDRQTYFGCGFDQSGPSPALVMRSTFDGYDDATFYYDLWKVANGADGKPTITLKGSTAGMQFVTQSDGVNLNFIKSDAGSTNAAYHFYGYTGGGVLQSYLDIDKTSISKTTAGSSKQSISDTGFNHSTWISSAWVKTAQIGSDTGRGFLMLRDQDGNEKTINGGSSGSQIQINTNSSFGALAFYENTQLLTDRYQSLNGFKSRTTSSIACTGGTFTIAPTGGAGSTFDVFTAGMRYSKTAETITITNDNTLHYVYYNDHGVLSVSTTAWDIGADAALVATVWKNGTSYRVGDERHDAERDRNEHKAKHKTFGAQFDVVKGGAALTVSSSAFSISACSIWDEDVENAIGTSTTCAVWYRNTGAATMKYDTTASAVLARVSGGALYYDNAGTLATVDNGKHIKNWVYGTNDTTLPIYCVTGQAQYNTEALATASPAPSFPGLTTQEWKLLYTVVWKNNSGTPTYVSYQDYRTAGSSPIGAAKSYPISAIVGTAYNLAAFDINGNGTSFALADTLIPYGTATGPATNAALKFTSATAALSSTILDFTGTVTKSTAQFLASSNSSIAIGSLHACATNGDSVAIGAGALVNSTKTRNVAIGYNALNTTAGTGYTGSQGNSNVAIGYGTLTSMTKGYQNFALGTLALNSLTEGFSHTAIGVSAMEKTTTGRDCIIIGAAAGQYWTNPRYSIGIGSGTLCGENGTSTDIDYNTVIGYYAGPNHSGHNNTFIGALSAYNGETRYAMAGNVFIGYKSGFAVGAVSNKLIIHNDTSTEATGLLTGDFSTGIIKVLTKLGVGMAPTNALDVTGATIANTFAGASAITTNNSTASITAGMKTTTALTQFGSYTAHQVDFVYNATMGACLNATGFGIGKSATVALDVSGVILQEGTAAGSFFGTRNSGTTATLGASIGLSRSRGTTAAATNAVVDGDSLAIITAYGADGTSTSISSSQIMFNVMGTVGTGAVGGKIRLRTATAAGTMTDSLTVDNVQGVTVAGAFGCNGKTAQTAYTVGAAASTGGTGTTAGAYDTAAHRDALISLVNKMRLALIANGIAVA